jgi:hypothetical protein
MSGGNPNVYREYPIASAYDTRIGTGDPVALIADGTITRAAAGARLLGVFAGVDYVNASGDQVFSSYWPEDTVATSIKARVIADPNVTFEVESGKSTAPDQTDVGLMADHVAANASTLHGTSAAYLSGTQATSDAGFRILALIDKPYNTGAQYDTVEVSIWEHEYNRQGDVATPGV